MSNLTSNSINKFEKKISGKGTARAGKGFTLFISNEDMNDIIKIIKLLEDSGVSIHGVTETVKHEINKQEGGFLGALLAPLAASLVEPVTYMEEELQEQEEDICMKIFSFAPSFKQYRDY